MEFDKNISQIQSFLSHSDRTVGVLREIKFGKDPVAIKTMVEQMKTCIYTIPDCHQRKCHFFLLLSTTAVVESPNLFEDFSHLIGIAPSISMDLFVALSIEVTLFQEYFFEATACMPESIAGAIIECFVGSWYFTTCFNKQVVERIDRFHSAICHHILTNQTLSTVFLANYTTFLDKLKGLSSSDSFTLLTLLSSSLLALKTLFSRESPFVGNKWREFYGGFFDPINVAYKGFDSLDLKVSIIHTVRCILFIIPEYIIILRKDMTDEVKTLCALVGLRAYECTSCMLKKGMLLDDLSSNEMKVLTDFLSSFKQAPRMVTDQVGEAGLIVFGNEDNVDESNLHCHTPWLHSLYRKFKEVEGEKQYELLATEVHNLDTSRILRICSVLLSSYTLLSKEKGSLLMKSLQALDSEKRLPLLAKRIKLHGSKDIFVDFEDCEVHIIETLNRLVAHQDAKFQDKLTELAIQSPPLVVRHVLLKAAQNELFSTSVIPKLLETLDCVFKCPLRASEDTTPGIVNLSEHFLSDIMLKSQDIGQEFEGIRSLAKQLFLAGIVRVADFLQICVFPLLYNYAEPLNESSSILLLELLLDVQTGQKDWSSTVNLSSLLVLLGHLLEITTNTDNGDATLVREILIRNINEIFVLPNHYKLIQGAERLMLSSEVEALSPQNRHYFSPLSSEWGLFQGQNRTEIIATLSTVLPSLHVSEWHLLLKELPRLHDDHESDNAEAASILCAAVNLIVTCIHHRQPAELNINLKRCVRNLASAVRSCIDEGFSRDYAPEILEQFLFILEPFLEPDQFELAMFVLPLMLELISFGTGNKRLLTAFGEIVLETRVRCVRKELGREVRKHAREVIKKTVDRGISVDL